MVATSIVLPTEYPLTLLACVCLTIECFMLGPLLVGPTRLKIFNEDFMKQFKDEHQAAFGTDSEPAKGGFPDCGEGRYSEKLEYKDWHIFNLAMRIHLNFVEMMPYLIGVLCISGLYLPLITCIIAWLNVGTRILYITMYFNNGPNARRLGMLLG